MKKLFIFFVLLSFFSVMPSFALKVIVNEGTDRTVPSRCSGPSNVIEEYTEEPNNDVREPDQEELVEKSNDYNSEKYELVYKPLLGANIRPELAGTSWGYPVNNIEKSTNEQEKLVNNESDESAQVKEVTLKRFTREAADYYILDTINRPNEIIPAGFETVIQE